MTNKHVCDYKTPFSLSMGLPRIQTKSSWIYPANEKTTTVLIVTAHNFAGAPVKIWQNAFPEATIMFYGSHCTHVFQATCKGAIVHHRLSAHLPSYRP